MTGATPTDGGGMIQVVTPPNRPSAAVAAAAAAVALVAASAGATAHAAAGTAPRVVVTAPRRIVPGRRPVLRWPATGEGAVAVAGIGLVGESPNQRRVPIASLTKMMTALVVLHDHPLAPGQAGPTVSFSPDDVQHWEEDVKAGDSVVEVRAGETMTEFQLLEGLLVPSGDNIADRLATWDAGSINAFVAKMNRAATTLHLHATHYADPSGLDPRSASTAAEQAFVASELMADPVVRSIVRRQRINLPVVGIIRNRNPALRTDGIVGVKGGYTTHAHHCLVTAAFRVRHRTLVVSVALGQESDLAAAHIDERLLEAVTSRLWRSRLAAPGARIGTLIPPGGASVGLVAPEKPPAAVVWPGLSLTVAIAPLARGSAGALRSARPGTIVGTLTYTAPWGVVASAPVRVARAPRAP